MKMNNKIQNPVGDTDALALYYFHQGTSCEAYAYLGAHALPGGGYGYVFRVWAPNAETVSVCGDFCDWHEGLPMKRVSGAGVWSVEVPSAVAGQNYKYRIVNQGRVFLKADPYAAQAQCPPETASVLAPDTPYAWHDAGWLAYRAAKMKPETCYRQPMNIYEVHLGSWKRHEDGSYYHYEELADELAPYVKQMGYTHVELMPVMEHPFDGSWGYQVTGYYAPTARYGSAAEFKSFVDKMHMAGIGVILDWVPAHFPKDAHGLYEFDGQPLYEYQGSDRMEHAGWGTRRFDVGRPEVESFLVSNACCWVKEFHADALRVDAVSSMLYLDFDRQPGEWVPNVYGDNRCLEAIAFFQKLNGAVRRIAPDVLMIAEESSAYPGVTADPPEGLGFSLKWNMGWMNDTLSYGELDPIYRKFQHNKLTFSLTYAFSERYLLPISHDEVVHGKKSFLDKCPGDYWRKFATARTLLGYQITHPGKKLFFMGSEIGQFREWNYEGQVEWHLLGYDMHAKFQHYAAALNAFYLATPALWERDDSWDGFTWIDADNRDESTYSYRRRDAQGGEVLVILNFTPVVRDGFRLAVPCEGEYREIFNSDEEKYGGSGVCNPGPLVSVNGAVSIRVPPLGMSIFRFVKNDSTTVDNLKTEWVMTPVSASRPRTEGKQP